MSDDQKSKPDLGRTAAPKYSVNVSGGTHVNVAMGDEVHQTNTVQGVDARELNRLIDSFQESLSALPTTLVGELGPQIVAIKTEAKAGRFQQVKSLVLAILAILAITADSLQVHDGWSTVQETGQAIVRMVDGK